MMHYRELERRCAERLAGLAREQELVRQEAVLRTTNHAGQHARAIWAAWLVRLAARLDPARLPMSPSNTA